MCKLMLLELCSNIHMGAPKCSTRIYKDVELTTAQAKKLKDTSFQQQASVRTHITSWIQSLDKPALTVDKLTFASSLRASFVRSVPLPQDRLDELFVQ